MAGTQYRGSEIKDVDQFLKDSAGLSTEREKEIGQHIGYRYDVNLLPDYERLTPYLRAYMEFMGWDDLNWLEDVHMGYEAGQPAIFDRNINGWVRIPKEMKLPDNQQDRDMLARELLVRAAPDDPGRAADRRRDAGRSAVHQYGTRDARLDHGLRLGAVAGRHDRRQGAGGRSGRPRYRTLRLTAIFQLRTP